MRAVLCWQETPPEKDGVRNVCYDLCFKPDGTQLIAGVGDRVLVFDPNDGELLHVLKGHKDAVYAVEYAHNGKRFASGGADKTVIIWTSKVLRRPRAPRLQAEGILKYTHNDSIQCLAYNPVTHQLASGTATDYGLWSPEQKAVAKHKVTSKVLCMAWTGDGMLLALGMYDGSVSVRDRSGIEQRCFSAAGSPAWSVAWSPQEPPTLAVGCLDCQLKFFDAAGQPIGKERTLPGDPLSLAFLGADYLLVGGSDRCVHLHTREGVALTRVTQRGAWVWVARPRPTANAVAVGCEDGSVAIVQLAFATVHGLHGERYVYRDAMTDVVIQHLVTDQRVRIKCRDYVKKVAVYRDRVAVALPTRVVVYALEPGSDEATCMQYRGVAKIQRRLDCNLLVVLAQHVLLCQERQLQLLSYEGVLVRQWLLDAAVRYVKVAGGPPGREGVLVGLKSGSVLKVFADNPFPVPLIKHGAGVRCLDLSSSRRRLALVDEANVLAVYDLLSKEVLYEAKGASSVAWNSAFDDMLCFSSGSMLSIRTSDFPVVTQKMQGFAVGFRGSKVFSLHQAAVATIAVPQSSAMARYVERGDVAAAYEIACLGVTEADWRALAAVALQALELDTAHAAYVRLRSVRDVELVSRVAARLAAGTPRRLLLAEVAACQGRFNDAAELFVAEGQLDKALDMFTSMRMFDDARLWAERASSAGGGAGAFSDSSTRGEGQGVAPRMDDLIGRHAEWSEETADYEAATEMYIKARRYERAIALLERHGWWDRLHMLMRSLDRVTDAKALRAAVSAFHRAGRFDAAKEGLLRLGDIAGLLQLTVEAGRWQDAFLLADAHPGLADQAYGPYARWLAERDRFEEACAAYARAGQPERGVAMLRSLADAAVEERRFADAAHQHYRLAMAALPEVRATGAAASSEDAAALARFGKHYEYAELYHAYALVHDAAVQPFKTVGDSTLFNAARFLVLRLAGREPPHGVALSEVLLALASVARAQAAYKLARYAYSRLQTLALPPAVCAEVELASLLLRGQPLADAEELLPVCYRCAATNPLLNAQGDFCAACGAPFERSFITFEALPLVEFELEPGISEQEVAGLLGQDMIAGLSGRHGAPGSCRSRNSCDGSSGGSGGADVLRLGDGGDDSAAEDGSSFEAQAALPHTPIRLGRAALRRLRPSEVLARRWPNPALPVQWYRLLDPEAAVVVGPCGHFFEAEEYDAALLERGSAPLSRQPAQAREDGAPGAQDGIDCVQLGMNQSHNADSCHAWPSLAP